MTKKRIEEFNTRCEYYQTKKQENLSKRLSEKEDLLRKKRIEESKIPTVHSRLEKQLSSNSGSKQRTKGKAPLQ